MSRNITSPLNPDRAVSPVVRPVRARRSPHGATWIVAACAFAGLVGCSGAQTPPSEPAAKASSEPAATAKETTTPPPSASESVSTPPSDTASAAAAPAEPPCPYDVSKPIKSKYGTAEVVTGCLNPSTVNGIVSQAYTVLRQCYEPERKGNPKLKGIVKVRVSLDSSGVRDTTVSRSEIAVGDFVPCVIKGLERIQSQGTQTGKAKVDYTAEVVP